MDWDAHLSWGEEIFAMLVILPAPVLFVALLWYVAPRLQGGKNSPSHENGRREDGRL